LRQEAPKLCNQCHETQALGPNPPEHLNAKANCLTCHSGHGGSQQTFLLPQPAPASAPTTLPGNIRNGSRVGVETGKMQALAREVK